MPQTNLITKIVRAGDHAVKSFLGFDGGYGGIINAEIISPSNYTSSGTAFGNNSWMFNGAGAGMDVFFSYNGLQDIVKAYEYCPPVYSIINKQAYAYVNGRTFVTDKKGKEAETPWAKKVKKLLAKPNAFQNGKQFEAQAAIYLRLFGYCVILPIKPVGFKNDTATALWIIPPYMCEFTYADQTFFNLKKGFIKSINVKYGNDTTPLDPEDVIILRDITPGFETLFLPNSPIKPIQQNISNLIGLYNSKGALINYRGALGIFTPEVDPNGAIPSTPDEVGDWQAELMQYGLRSGQRKAIVAPMSLKWQPIGISYRDLMLSEWSEDDTMVIADALNYPYKLLSNSSSSSMNGTEANSWENKLYQNFVIPFAEMIYEQISEAFDAEANNCKIEKDYSHITILQEDKINAGRARLYLNQGCQIEWLNDVITRNQWLLLNEMNPVMLESGNPDPDGDKYYSQLVAEGKIKGSAPPVQGAIADQQNAADTSATSTQNN